MESLIPQILFLGPVFAPLILRVAVAVVYALLAHTLWQKRTQIAAVPVPLIGKPGVMWVTVAAVLSALIALAFATGIWTQAAAVLGLAGSIKGFVLAKRYPMIATSRTTYFLVALICLTLIVTGAGAFAIDKPY